MNEVKDVFEDQDELYQFIKKIPWNLKPKKREDGETYIPVEFFMSRIKRDNILCADWDKKTTPPKQPHYTRLRTNDPGSYGVFSHTYKELIGRCEIDKIIHTPNVDQQQNEAHCDIICTQGMSKEEIKRLSIFLSEKAKWKINYDDPVINLDNKNN